MTALLDEVIDAHGGRRRWSRAREIHAHIRSGGLLMRTKFKHRQFASYRISVGTAEPSVLIEPYPRAGGSGVFSGDSVRILTGEGQVEGEREGAREAFFGLSGVMRKLRWDDLDALYFAGYANWNYMTAPFLFERPGFEAAEGAPIEVEGERWRRLDVRFPEHFHTHCRDQSLYYDERGLLRRHDYSPDVISSHANAAHLCDGHREFDGLVFPTSRRVVPKGPGRGPLPGPTIVSLELDSITVA